MQHAADDIKDIIRHILQTGRKCILSEVYGTHNTTVLCCTSILPVHDRITLQLQLSGAFMVHREHSLQEGHQEQEHSWEEEHQEQLTLNLLLVELQQQV